MKKLITFFLTLFVASSVWAKYEGYSRWSYEDYLGELSIDYNGYEYFDLGYLTFITGNSKKDWNLPENCVAVMSGGEFLTKDAWISYVKNTLGGKCDIPATVTYNGKTYTVTEIWDIGGKNDGEGGITSITIPETVTYVGYIGDNTLTSIIFPRSVTFIDWIQSTSLTSITISSSITELEEQAFEDCPNLINVTCLATTPPKAYSNSFDNYNGYLYIPCESREAYETHTCWGSFKHIMCGTTAIPEVSTNAEITISNNQIFLNGEAPAFVVTVSGQKIANANLKAGVYFVVEDGNSVKVVVR